MGCFFVLQWEYSFYFRCCRFVGGRCFLKGVTYFIRVNVAIRMTSSHRIFKRLGVFAILFFTTTSFLSGWYFLVRPVATCFDGLQNQDERGVDCGGTCGTVCVAEYHPEALVAQELAFVPGGDRSVYDVIAKVHNPNDVLGASTFRYVIILKGAAGDVVATKSGSGFILPQETKDFLVVNLFTSADPVTAEIEFSDMTWEEFSGYQEKPKLSVLNKTYAELTSGAFFSEVVGNVFNDSPFDFRSLTVKIILRDIDGKPLAINQTEINTVLSKELREFRLKWPKAFPGEVRTIEVEAEADVYHSDNFIQRYLPGGKFQEMQGVSR